MMSDSRHDEHKKGKGKGRDKDKEKKSTVRFDEKFQRILS